MTRASSKTAAGSPRRLAYTAREAAALIGVPLQTLYDIIHRGEIAVVRYGNGKQKQRFLILPADLEAWLLRRRVPARWEESA